jgi:phosphate transport system substrate-binding protein
MKRRFILFFTISLFISGSAFENKVLTLKGSDTMVILVQKWTEVYPDKSVQFQVTGGGSGTGIASLINGTTDICSSSRPMKSAEASQMKQKYGKPPIEIRVARDGLSVYVHKSNMIKALTIKQLGDIFTGKIKNWKEVGGPNHKIILYSRENNSGTYEFFKEHVLMNKDFDPSAQHMPGTSAVVGAIAMDEWGIGYGGAAYTKGVNEVKVSLQKDSIAYLPTEENILNGKYPISRFLYFYLRERPMNEIKQFIDWVISNKGQKVVLDVGYFPTKKL